MDCLAGEEIPHRVCVRPSHRMWFSYISETGLDIVPNEV